MSRTKMSGKQQEQQDSDIPRRPSVHHQAVWNTAEPFWIVMRNASENFKKIFLHSKQPRPLAKEQVIRAKGSEQLLCSCLYIPVSLRNSWRIFSGWRKETGLCHTVPASNLLEVYSAITWSLSQPKPYVLWVNQKIMTDFLASRFQDS